MMLSRDLESTPVSSSLLLDPLPPDTRERLIRVPLDTQDSVLLPLEQLTEILRVDFAEILSIPEMPSCVVGICNWRGEMLWLVDFNHFVGYPSLFQQEQFCASLTVLVIQPDRPAIARRNEGIGIVVSQVHEIELHDLQRLHFPTIGLFSPDLLPLVRGMLPGGDPVLDLQAFVECPL
ncbi:chemotaxis protein CheW [Phormidesmis priestleyi]